MSKSSIGYLIAAGVCCSLLAASAAFARREHAAAGYPASVGAVGCWDNSGAFMTNLCSTSQAWVIAVPNTGQATAGGSVTLIGQVLAGGSAQCNLSAFTTSGTQASGFPRSFPALPSSVGSSTVSFGPLDSSLFLLVGCVASGGGKVRLLGVDYP
jgi:hypothetical protein